MEALDLLVLGEQAGDGVVEQVDEAELPGALVVVMSPIATGMSPLPGFLRSSATIGSDSSIPATGTPRVRDASGDPTRPNRELQGRPATCPLGEEFDGWAEDLRRIQVGC
jgi:hypothetical protein